MPDLSVDMSPDIDFLCILAGKLEVRFLLSDFFVASTGDNKFCFINSLISPLYDEYRNCIAFGSYSNSTIVEFIGTAAKNVDESSRLVVNLLFFSLALLFASIISI